MANYPQNDAACFAYWSFNTGDFLGDQTDYEHDLTDSNTVTEDTTNKWEGSASALFVSAQNETLDIDDIDLDSSFPFKDGSSNDIATIAFAFRPTAGGPAGILNKHNAGSDNRSIILGLDPSDQCRMLWGHTGGTDVTAVSHATALTVDGSVTYFVAFVIVGSGGSRNLKIRLYQVGIGHIGTDIDTDPGNDLNIPSGANLPLVLGGNGPGSGTYDGNLDAFMIFNDAKSDADLDAIWAGTYLAMVRFPHEMSGGVMKLTGGMVV